MCAGTIKGRPNVDDFLEMLQTILMWLVFVIGMPSQTSIAKSNILFY